MIVRRFGCAGHDGDRRGGAPRAVGGRTRRRAAARPIANIATDSFRRNFNAVIHVRTQAVLCRCLGVSVLAIAGRGCVTIAHDYIR